MNIKQNLSIDKVKHIAKLANLIISEALFKKLTSQLSNILDLVGKLNEVDTKNVIPTSQVTGLTNIFREDSVEPSLSQAEALSNAPRKHDGYIVVDAILEE